jgi:hypothetical protein
VAIVNKSAAKLLLSITEFVLADLLPAMLPIKTALDPIKSGIFQFISPQEL